MIGLGHWLAGNTSSFYSINHLTDSLKSHGHWVRKSSVADWLTNRDHMWRIWCSPRCGGAIVTWRTDATIPVGFGTVRVMPVWRFLLVMDSRT